MADERLVDEIGPLVFSRITEAVDRRWRVTHRQHNPMKPIPPLGYVEWTKARHRFTYQVNVTAPAFFYGSDALTAVATFLDLATERYRLEYRGT